MKKLLLTYVFALTMLLSSCTGDGSGGILPPVTPKQYASIIGIKVSPPSGITFYTDGPMTEAEKKLMVESFITAVVIPEKDLWVNLIMEEPNRIAPFTLGGTELGRVMLEQDLLLKRAVSASLHPQRMAGYKFWSWLYKGRTDVKYNIYTKSWIYSSDSVVVDQGREMFIKKAELNVRQENITSDVPGYMEKMEELVLPEVKRYVLYDEAFIPIRQVYRAVICGIWFKNKYKDTFYNYIINTNKTGSVEIADKGMKFDVYKRYAKSYKEKEWWADNGKCWGGINFDKPFVTVEKSPMQDGGSVEAQLLADLFDNPAYEYLDSLQTEALGILEGILRKDNLSFDREEMKVQCLKVAKQLFLRPDFKSKDIANTLGMVCVDLRQIYRVLKASPELQELITEKSRYSRLVEYTTKYLLKYSDRLERAFNDQLVYPVIVEWHPGEICDSACVFCYNKGLSYADKGRPLFEIQKSKQLLQEFVDNDVKEFWVSGGKEPLTNPTTADVIHYAAKLGLQVKLYTNGIRLVKNIQEKLLNAQWVRISLNAATPETYHIVQGISADTFDKVRGNIRSFVSLRNKEKSRLSIGMSFLVNPWNYTEILQAADNARDLGVDFLAYNSDVAGMVRRYTPEEIEVILDLIKTLRQNEKDGLYGKLHIEIRALSREELEGKQQLYPDMDKAKYCDMKVIKANMNPYGVFHLCDYAGQPINERPEVRVGDVNFESFRDMLHNIKGVKFETTKCKGCLIRESGFNIILEKLRADREFGIPLTDQPYKITLEDGVEFLGKKNKRDGGLVELSDAREFSFNLIPSSIKSTAPVLKEDMKYTVTDIGGIDLNARVDVEGDYFNATGVDEFKWRYSDSVSYTFNNP